MSNNIIGALEKITKKLTKSHSGGSSEEDDATYDYLEEIDHDIQELKEISVDQEKEIKQLKNQVVELSNSLKDYLQKQHSDEDEPVPPKNKKKKSGF